MQINWKIFASYPTLAFIFEEWDRGIRRGNNSKSRLMNNEKCLSILVESRKSFNNKKN